jgi:aldose sugar dehydrogenase
MPLSCSLSLPMLLIIELNYLTRHQLTILNTISMYLLMILVSSFITNVGLYTPSYAQDNNNNFGEFRQREFTEQGAAAVSDSNLKVEEVASGLELPTTMAFLGPGDILVLEKEKGTVQRIVDGQIQPEPLLDVNVAGAIERCMCGIAISKDISGHTYVFLYYTEAETADREDMTDGKAPLGNRLYRYELVDDKLINPKLLLDLPADPGPRHNGGKVIIGPDNNLYVTVGDIDGSFKEEDTETQAQNYPDGVEPDGRSGILRITQDGSPLPKGAVIGAELPLNLYYAYGLRNSFGTDFDPVTGNLWDTENGPGNSDEINLVLPGFNSGWQQAMGLAADEEANDAFNPDNLVDFDGKGTYSDPELVWRNTAGPTAVVFLHSDRLGPQYQNDMFVGDVHNGRLYHFKLNEERTDLILPESLATRRVIETPQDPGLGEIIFGEGFGGITDLEVGPDGYLYLVSIGQGKIFKIVPAEER